MTTDGLSQSTNEAYVDKIYSTRGSQYPGSAVDGLINHNAESCIFFIQPDFILLYHQWKAHNILLNT